MVATQPRVTAAEPPARRQIDAPLLECRGITKRFGAVEALTDVDFTIHRGEVVALVGDNGAGKSTLIKAISGIQPPDRGTLFFQGQETSIRSPRDATKLGISTAASRPRPGCGDHLPQHRRRLRGRRSHRRPVRRAPGGDVRASSTTPQEVVSAIIGLEGAPREPRDPVSSAS